MVHPLKTASALAFALLAVTFSTSAVYNSYSQGEVATVPPVPGDMSLLYGQVTSAPVAVNNFTSEQVELGVILPGNAHNFFSCETGQVHPTATPATSGIRYWIYEFTGNEPPFSGDFFLSPAELNVSPQYSSLNTLLNIEVGRRYYVMSASDLEFSCSTGISASNYCGDNLCTIDEDIYSCPQDCNICGDGVVAGGEQCDDNNFNNNDGCNDLCATEPGWTCAGDPSMCEPLIPSLMGGNGPGNRVAPIDEPPVVNDPDPITELGCSDTDPEINNFEQGTITLPDGSTFTDICQGPTLIDYHCGPDEEMAAMVVDCPDGCTDGACNSVTAEPPVSGTVGNLYITKDTTPRPKRQLLASALGDTVLGVRFGAEGEYAAVTNINFGVEGNADSIDTLELFRIGETVPFATATQEDCSTPSTSTWCALTGNGKLVVQDGEEVDVLVRPRLHASTAGAVSGDTFAIVLGSVRAFGGTTLEALEPQGDTRIASDEHTVVLAKITSVTNANSDPDGSAIPIGNSAIAAFRFASASTPNGTNTATVQDLIFTVDATNVSVETNSFRAYETSDSTRTSQCIAVSMAGTPIASPEVQGEFYVLCSDLDAMLRMNPSQSKVLNIEASVLNPMVDSASSSALSVRLTNFTDPDTAFNLGGNHILWSDSEEVFDWIEYPASTVRSTTYSF